MNMLSICYAIIYDYQVSTDSALKTFIDIYYRENYIELFFNLCVMTKCKISQSNVITLTGIICKRINYTNVLNIIQSYSLHKYNYRV